MSMDRIMQEEARLVMLRSLYEQPNYSLNEALLAKMLESFGIFRPRAWVREEMRYCAAVGAMTVTEMGSVLIGTLTSKGREHVERRLVIEGIKRMGPEQ